MGKTSTKSRMRDLMNSDGVIAWFDDFGDPKNPGRFLSNFYVGEPLIVPGLDWDYWTEELEGPVEFQTGEHLFAAMKAHKAEDFHAIVSAKGPGTAKSIGRSIELWDMWEQVKYDAMMLTLRTKFTLDRAEGAMLLETGDKLLIEGTLWRDQVWGVDIDSRKNQLNPLTAPGRNWLGTMLMARRAELRAEQQWGVVSSAGEWNWQFIS